jgi:hypothetical protein
MGFMAAVLSGRCYHAETTQFVAAINALHQTPQYRGFETGALRTHSFIQPRGFAWAMRTLGQAIVVSPDSDPLQAEFLSQVRATARFNHDAYVARPHNTQGFMHATLPGLGDYSPGRDPYTIGGWMLDFCTASVGYVIDCVEDLGADDDKLNEWFVWIAQSVVGRFGGEGETEYLYRDAAPYNIAAAPLDAANWSNASGPWYADWGQVWRATIDETKFPREIGDGSLREGFIGNVGSYWSNLTPALAYAVEHNVPGARQAWAKFSGAPNFESGVVAPLRKSPEWGVFPRSV